MSTPTNYSAAAFKPKTRVKIAEPGIYSKLNMSEVNYDDSGWVEFSFEHEDGRYQSLRLFLNIVEENVRKGQTTIFTKKGKVPSGDAFEKAVQEGMIRAEQEVLTKLCEIAMAIGKEDDMDKIQGKSYMDLIEKYIKYIKNVPNKSMVNIKITMDYKDEYACIEKRAGNIEKFIEGKDPQLRFTAWEMDNGKDKRVVSGSKPASSSPFAPPVPNAYQSAMTPTNAPFGPLPSGGNAAPTDFNQPAAPPAPAAADDDLPF